MLGVVNGWEPSIYMLHDWAGLRFLSVLQRYSQFSRWRYSAIIRVVSQLPDNSFLPQAC